VTINKVAANGKTPVALNFQQAYNATNSPWLSLVRDCVLGDCGGLPKNNDQVTGVLGQ
jgi:multiple sugar transport system substrate-binding protein